MMVFNSMIKIKNNYITWMINPEGSGPYLKFLQGVQRGMCASTWWDPLQCSSSFRPEASCRMASTPVLCLFPHCNARCPHQEHLAAQWREACQQSSPSVYGASCFLGIQQSFIIFCLGFSWSSR